MGQIIMIQERYFCSSNQLHYKIIMAGDPNVGKTTLFWKYIEGEFLPEKSSAVTTIDFKIKEVTIRGEPVKLYIWDTAGQERYRSIISAYFNGCNGVMLVFDLTSPESFTSVTTKWYQLARARSPEAQLLLVGNKSDLQVACDERLAEEWARQHGAKYVRTSVKLDLNVREAYAMLSQAISNVPLKEKGKSFVLRSSVGREQRKKKRCC